MATTYNTGNGTWTYGERMSGGMHDWHKHLGPCPLCGTITFDYGGGWRCLANYCHNNPNNPIGNLGAAPAWWNTGIQVYKDGSSWCAVGSGFTNLQESPAGFGNTPQEAVNDLLIKK